MKRFRKTSHLVVLMLLALPANIHCRDSRPSDSEKFHQVSREGAVDIDKEYALDNLQIPKNEIHTLLPRDAIPALTNPEMESVHSAKWLPGDARIIAVTVGDETIGVPLIVMDRHEIVNMTVGGRPIAVTYCPLCDSAAVFSREIAPRGKQGVAKPIVLEFGVSGALFNSNVLMYDQRDKALWSQLGMRAVSGPLAGTTLESLPVQVVSFSQFDRTHPLARIVSRKTGHELDYSVSPYCGYMQSEELKVPVAQMGSALPRKTQGMGVASDTESWFVPATAIADAFTLQTPLGDVRLTKTSAGVAVVEVPKGLRTAQTFYYSWSAFYPMTQVIKPGEQAGTRADSAAPGLALGDKAPDAALTTMDGKIVQLASLYKDGPIVLTFYRGGWCPICNRALSAWQDKLDDLKAAGGAFVALSPEKPDHASRTIEKGHLSYTVLSDPKFEAAKAFRVHFVVDEGTKAKYKQFGMNVAEANASGTWELPAPATFVIDRNGVIRYVFADWDYKKRAEPDEVIAAVKSLTKRR
jgi:peroxiredoxin